MKNNNITDLRKAKGLSMAALAERVETSQQQIDRLEKGKRKLTVDWIDKLCTALDCKVDELVEFSSESANTNSRKSKISTVTATIIGAIEAGFSNMVRAFDEDEKYQISFRSNAKGGKFFGLIVEGGSYGKYPENSELIFSEIDNEELKIGMAESDNNFISSDNTNKHRFVISNKIITAELVKSIRSE